MVDVQVPGGNMAFKTTGVLEEEAKMKRLLENSHSVPQHEAKCLGGN